MFFMDKAKSHIIEIRPTSNRDCHHFRNLAKFCKIGYTMVNQSEDHADIDVSEVVQLTENALLVNN